VVSENPDAASRRTLLTVAGATALAGAVAGISACGSGSASKSGSTTSPPPANEVEIRLLNRALDLEYRAAALYTAIVPLLAGRAHAAAKLFLEQELAHATTLAGLIANAEGKPTKQRSNYDIGRARGLHGVFEMLVTLENAQVAAYLDAITQLNRSSDRASVASILANDAQHLSVALLTLGRNPIPEAFVTGRA
jgi:bacterioferritin (cytochrome b1)